MKAFLVVVVSALVLAGSALAARAVSFSFVTGSGSVEYTVRGGSGDLWLEHRCVNADGSTAAIGFGQVPGYKGATVRFDFATAGVSCSGDLYLGGVLESSVVFAP